MVTLVMQAAGREASGAVVTASRGVSSETRRFSQAGNARVASLRGPAHRPRPLLPPGKPLSLAKSEGFIFQISPKEMEKAQSAMVHPRPQRRLMAEEGELLKLS